MRTARRRLLSAIGPRITARIIGEDGISTFCMMYPIMPKPMHTHTSKMLLFMEYAPTMESVTMTGMMIRFGSSTTRQKSRTPRRPKRSISTFPTSSDEKSPYTMSAFFVNNRGPGCNPCMIRAPNSIAVTASPAYKAMSAES